MKKQVHTPMTKEIIRHLKAGDQVLISGILYTGRDAAHMRLYESLLKGEPLPFQLEGQIIYYVGPAPTKPGEIIGSCGPTTSYRMDSMTPLLLEHGLKGMIGKGKRSQEVMESMIKEGAVYFAAIGGAGALIAKSVESVEVIAYDDLGPEAIHKLVVKDFPCVVVVDAYGNNMYETETKKFKRL
jgi:fumarate hydratase subunit beta